MTDVEARGRGRRRFAFAAITACVVAGGVGIVAWGNNGDARGVRTVDSTTVSPAEEAERVAVDLRDSAVLPAGAEPYSGAPPSALTGPFESRATPNIVDLHRIWIVDESSEQVVDFLRNHAPRALSMEACCAVGRGTDGIVVAMVQYFDPATSAVIDSANLQVSVARRSATTTWVRADAQVVWRARRDPTERVPVSDQVITITRMPTMTIGSTAAPRPVVVTDREQVDRLESSFNNLLVAVPDVKNGCEGPTYTVRFSVSGQSAPDVVATVNCGDVGVTIDGRHATTLDASRFTSQVAGLVPN